MNPTLQQLAQLLHSRHARLLAGLFALAAIAALPGWSFARSHTPSEEELERRRRGALAATGRITDGVLLDALEDDWSTGAEAAESTAAGLEIAPLLSIEPQADELPSAVHHPHEVLLYSYRIAGVTYNCAQDISLLAERIRGLRIDGTLVGQTVQVRYDPHNPGNSILVAESWTGLWQHHP